MYAQHLGTGSTLYCRQIKVDNVKRYIRNFASSFALCGKHERNLRKDNATDVKLSPILISVFDELQRREKAPNHRKPFTIEMLKFWEQRVFTTSALPASLTAAILDWFECGLFAGTQRSEWAQDPYQSDTSKRPQLNIWGDPQAFCLGDVRVSTHIGARYTRAAILQVPCSAIYRCWITFRILKNGNIGEEKIFTCNKNPGGREFVQPMYRIIQRFVQLRAPHDIVTPLAIHASPTLSGDAAKFITAPDV
jgi:hypothetical protein